MAGAVVTIRASSVGDLLDCAHRWEGKHLLGMTGRTGGRAWLGSSVHAATAWFDEHRGSATVAQAVEVFHDHLDHPEAHDADPNWVDISPNKARITGGALTIGYCREWSPRWEMLAVEKTLNPQDLTVPLDRHGLDAVTIRLTGTMDRCRIARVAGSDAAGIVDYKTGARAVTNGAATTKGHAAQVGIYTVLTNMDPEIPLMLTQPPAILGMSTAGDSAIAIAEIPDAVEQLTGTETEPGLLEYAGLYLKTGLFPPNPKSQLCSESYCPRWSTCRFKG